MRVQKRIMLTALGAAMPLLFMAGPSEAATASRPQRFVVILTPDSGIGRVIATGPITGVGTVSNGDAPDGQPFNSTFSLPGGDVFLTVTPTSNTFNPDPRSCVASATGTDAFRITGGTGAFRGAIGSGNDTGRGTFVFARNPDGTCNLDAPPVAGVFIVQGSGTASVG